MWEEISPAFKYIIFSTEVTMGKFNATYENLKL